MGEHDAEYWFTLAKELEKEAEQLDEIEQIKKQYDKKEEAMEAYCRGLEQDPNAYHMRERFLYLCRNARASSDTKVEVAMKRVIAVRPKDEELLTALMWNLRGQGKQDEADTLKVRIDSLDTSSEDDVLNRRIRHYDPDSEDPDDLDPITRLYEEEFADEEESDSSLQATEPKKPNIMDMFETDGDVEEIQGPLFDTEYPVEDVKEEESDVDVVVRDAILNYGRVEEPQGEEKAVEEELEEEDLDGMENLFG
jgi:hypothetical protein